MVRKINIFFLLSLLIVLTSCSKKIEIVDNSWQKEVLFASECGLDGLQCCIDTDNPCLYEQECCVDPNNPSMTYCADSCDYGTANTFCRGADPKCDDNMVCFEGYCQTAGGNNQPCFIDKTCNSGSICNGDICVECGLTGNPCCLNSEGNKCANEDIYEIGRNSCIDNICVECGYGSKIACASEPQCNDKHLMNNGFCLMCGQYNQPCCEKDEKIYCSEDLECTSGFCL